MRPPLTEPKPLPALAAAALPGAARISALAEWRARLLGWLAMLPALGFLPIVLAPPLNHDVAAVLDFSARMLAGERLYSQLIDVNPPLIFLLNLPAALLARWTPLDATQALLLCLLLLCAGVWRLCAALRREREEGPAERAVLGALLPLLLLCAGYDFGQREQIMAIAALPYLFLAERRIQGLRTAAGPWLAAVLMAALGFALKPHFLAVPALVEAVVLLARRDRPEAALRDPAPWAMAGIWLLYLGAIPVFFPDYFGHVVPLVWDWYVDLGGVPWWRVLLTEVMGSAAVMTLGLGALAVLGPGAGWLPRLLAAAMAGGMAAAIVQHKGWSYHLVPVWIWGGLACGVMLARFADRGLPAARARRAAPMLAAATAFAFALFTLRGGEAPWTQLQYAGSPGGRIAAWLNREAHGERLLVLSPDIPTVYPAVNYAGTRLVLPFMSTWLLQAVYQACPANGARYRAPWEMSRAEFYVYRSVAERFAAAPPAAVLVSRYTAIPWCGGNFDFVEYFSRHPLFAETWKQYRQKGEIDGYLLYAREE